MNHTPFRLGRLAIPGGPPFYALTKLYPKNHHHQTWADAVASLNEFIKEQESKEKTSFHLTRSLTLQQNMIIASTNPITAYKDYVNELERWVPQLTIPLSETVR